MLLQVLPIYFNRSEVAKEVPKKVGEERKKSVYSLFNIDDDDDDDEDWKAFCERRRMRELKQQNSGMDGSKHSTIISFL